MARTTSSALHCDPIDQRRNDERIMTYGGKYLVRACVFVGLTLLTQIGGLCYALGLASYRRSRGKGLLTALSAYALLTVLVVPPLAAAFGRMRLPCATGGEAPVVSATLLTCALNRGYVRPKVYSLLTSLGGDLNRQFPGSRLTTLEGNFPFVDGFPLLPHLSHRDGRKIDIAYFYRTAAGQVAVPRGSPSWLGYFIYERPRAQETASCLGVRTPLRWDLDWLQPARPAWVLDEPRTAWMLNWLKDQPQVTRLFIEPHLAIRLGVAGGKVRFQGCQAARHDDHIHVEVE
jgi:hypothetical protein